MNSAQCPVNIPAATPSNPQPRIRLSPTRVRVITLFSTEAGTLARMFSRAMLACDGMLNVMRGSSAPTRKAEMMR